MANCDWDIDPLLDLAIYFVTEKRRASISSIQRQFRIGYNRASRLIEQMEEIGVVSTQDCRGNREVLAGSEFDVDPHLLDAFKEKKKRQHQEELSSKVEMANSIDEQLRISAITNRKIVIWLYDTGSFSPSGNKILMLKSSSPFEHLAKQQKSKIKPGDIEYGDILDGYRFSATMQMRTPTSVLSQHGRIEKVPAHKLPRIVKQEWQGVWLLHLKPASEIGPWARDVKGPMASDVGYVAEDGGDFLRFLLFAHLIVEDNISDEERVRWLESCYHMVGSDGEAIGSFIAHYGDRADVALRVITNSVKKG